MTDLLEAENTVRGNLWTITSLWDEMLRPAVVGGGIRVTASKEPPLPIAAHVLDTRRDVISTLAFWAKVVHDERELTSHHDLGDVFDSARLVETHTAWLLEHDDLPGFADDIARLARDVQGIARPERKDRVRVGTCRKGIWGNPVVTSAQLYDKRPGHIHIENVSLDVLETKLKEIQAPSK